jgi:hypothetical protein
MRASYAFFGTNLEVALHLEVSLTTGAQRSVGLISVDLPQPLGPRIHTCSPEF